MRNFRKLLIVYVALQPAFSMRQQTEQPAKNWQLLDLKNYPTLTAAEVKDIIMQSVFK